MKRKNGIKSVGPLIGGFLVGYIITAVVLRALDGVLW